MYQNLQQAQILQTPKEGSFRNVLSRANLNLQPRSYVGSFDQEAAPSTHIKVDDKNCAIPTSGYYAPKFVEYPGYPKSVLLRSPLDESKQKSYTSEVDLSFALTTCSAHVDDRCEYPMYNYTNVQQIIYP